MIYKVTVVYEDGGTTEYDEVERWTREEEYLCCKTKEGRVTIIPYRGVRAITIEEVK